MPPDAIDLFERLVFVRGHYVLTVTVSHCLETQEGLCFPVDPNSQPSVIVICIYIKHDRNFPQVLSSNCLRDLGKIGSGSFGAIHLGTGVLGPSSTLTL